MDRLTSLTVFVRVVDNGGFSAAARHLNMSVQMASNHVRSLEERLGARLLNRTTRKVSLTEIGRAYYERSTRILADLAEADQAAGALQSTPRGTLRLHTSNNTVRLLAPIIAEFLALYPETAIDLVTGERMVDMVEEGVDLVIRAAPPPGSSLIVRSLGTWRHALCCSPGYLATHPVPHAPADLAHHNCLRYAFYPFGDEWRFIDADGQLAAVRVSGNLTTGSGDTLRTVALSGQGIFLAPGFVLSGDLEAGRLVPLLPEYRPVEFPITAVYPDRHYLSAKVRRFIDLLSQRIVEHGRWMNPGVT